MISDSRRSFVAAVSFVALLGFSEIRQAMASAPPGRYTVNAGTVVDNVLNLTWQRAVGGSFSSQGAALTYCSGLSLGGVAAGGWRLPRKLELESIVDFSRKFPAIDPVVFPNTPTDPQGSATSAGYFWTASSYIPNTTYWWIVDFSLGGSGSGGGASPFFARCVH